MPRRGLEVGVLRKKRFSWFGCELDRFMSVSIEHIEQKKAVHVIQRIGTIYLNK